MWTTICSWLLLLGYVAFSLAGCTPAWRPAGSVSEELRPGRYLLYFYRHPDWQPAQAAYAVEPFDVEQVQGLGPGTARTLFNEELLRAMQANGLSVQPTTPTCTLSGRVEQFTVASPTWRFFTGRGQARLRVTGEIRQGQEIVFIFQDQVDIAPAVHPRHQPPLEPALIARQAVRRFALNLLNELLLPPGHGPPFENAAFLQP